MIVCDAFNLVGAHSWCDPLLLFKKNNAVVDQGIIIIFAGDNPPSNAKWAYV
jgi:hypothetical protein